MPNDKFNLKVIGFHKTDDKRAALSTFASKLKISEKRAFELLKAKTTIKKNVSEEDCINLKCLLEGIGIASTYSKVVTLNNEEWDFDDMDTSERSEASIEEGQDKTDSNQTKKKHSLEKIIHRGVDVIAAIFYLIMGWAVFFSDDAIGNKSGAVWFGVILGFALVAFVFKIIKHVLGTIGRAFDNGMS